MGHANTQPTPWQICDTTESGDYVTVSGVLEIPESIWETDKEYVVYLVEARGQQKSFIPIGIPIGSKNIQMQALTDNFTLENIKI